MGGSTEIKVEAWQKDKKGTDVILNTQYSIPNYHSPRITLTYFVGSVVRKHEPYNLQCSSTLLCFLAMPLANSSSTSSPSHFRTWTYISMYIKQYIRSFHYMLLGFIGVYQLKLLLTWKTQKVSKKYKRAQCYLSHKAVTVTYRSFNWMLTDKNLEQMTITMAVVLCAGLTAMHCTFHTMCQTKLKWTTSWTWLL